MAAQELGNAGSSVESEGGLRCRSESVSFFTKD